MTDESVVERAQRELDAEKFAAEVEREKQRIIARASFWRRLFPFKITFKIERL